MVDDRGKPVAELAKGRGEAPLGSVTGRSGPPGWAAIGFMAVLAGLAMAASAGGLTAFLPGFLLTAAGGAWYRRRAVAKSARPGPDRVMLCRWLLAETCAGCGYGLRGLPEDEDGCIVCPECSAAWALARWKRDHPDLSPDVSSPGAGVSCRAVDARGRSVGLPARELPASVHALARLRTAIALACVVFTVVLGGTAAAAGGAAWDLIVAFGGSVLTIVVLMALEVRRGELAAARRALAAEHLRGGLCPRCLGPLSEARAVSDGARVCVGCGAAWDEASGVR